MIEKIFEIVLAKIRMFLLSSLQMNVDKIKRGELVVHIKRNTIGVNCISVGTVFPFFEDGIFVRFLIES